MRFDVYYPRGLIGDGGVTRSTWQWMQSLSLVGHSFRLLIDPNPPRPVENAKGIDVVPVRHTGLGRWRLPRNIGEHLEGSFLVLHSGYVPSNVIAAREARRRATPYIVVPHGAYHRGASRHRRYLKGLWKPLERVFLEQALGVHIFFKEEAPDIHRVAPKARLIVAPTGVEPTASKWIGGGGYMAWFGRYDIHVKGIDLLFRAWASLPKENRPTLVMRGKNSRNTSHQVLRLVAKFNLEDWISVGGPISDEEKVAFLKASEGCIFPSRGESHSMALTEALRMGVPCLVTSTMPISRLLEEERGAVVVRPDSDEIAAGVEELLTLGPALGRQGRSFVQRHLDWEKICLTFIRQISVTSATSPE